MKKGWFKELSPTMQVLLIIGVIILAWIIFNKAKGFLSSAGQYVETQGEIAGLQSQGQQKSYSASQYKTYADKLEYAMDGLGTDTDTIYAVFRKMNNTLDVIALEDAFGTRDGSDNLFGLLSGGDLAYWLRGDLSPSELNKLNSILSGKGITRSY